MPSHLSTPSKSDPSDGQVKVAARSPRSAFAATTAAPLCPRSGWCFSLPASRQMPLTGLPHPGFLPFQAGVPRRSRSRISDVRQLLDYETPSVLCISSRGARQHSVVDASVAPLVSPVADLARRPVAYMTSAPTPARICNSESVTLCIQAPRPDTHRPISLSLRIRVSHTGGDCYTDADSPI